MNSEYVKLSSSERNYGEKNLLHSQLELLDSMRRFELFKKLRGEEFALKIALKNKIQFIQEELDKIQSFLPKTEYGAPAFFIREEKKKKEDSLENEVLEIRRKLERLQREA